MRQIKVGETVSYALNMGQYKQELIAGVVVKVAPPERPGCDYYCRVQFPQFGGGCLNLCASKLTHTDNLFR